MLGEDMTVAEIEAWLLEDDPDRLAELWRVADETRREHVGDEVHIRGLVEVSNHCARLCTYCGLRAENASLPRYRLSADEVLAAARQAAELGWGSVVMQAGEDYGLTREWVADLIREIKRQTPLAVTLSLGERPREDLVAWREAGADRYLLRFETSDPALYALIHPPLRPGEPDRVERLRWLQELGYEAGGGVMIGIPGQSYAILARDIDLFRAMDLDMIGVGPYISNPDAPLGCGGLEPPELPEGEQVAPDETMAYKVVALTRIVRPDANLPSTTALATINRRSGRQLGLERGANVIMPNLTPSRYREMYRIYPGKAGYNETAAACAESLREFLASIGRRVGEGPGGRKRP
ncbi:MAG: [FeFe] hydrogenase H-cluster radical SAM maturase HydE [Armatimonadota bacterium]|jgi:biotin synthase